MRRALFETFAFLWDYDRAISKARETGTLEEFQDLSRRRLAATRNPKWLEINPEWEATNILTLITDYPKNIRACVVHMTKCLIGAIQTPRACFHMFADLDIDTRNIRFADHNEDAGWAFRLVRAAAGLNY